MEEGADDAGFSSHPSGSAEAFILRARPKPSVSPHIQNAKSQQDSHNEDFSMKNSYVEDSWDSQYTYDVDSWEWEETPLKPKTTKKKPPSTKLQKELAKPACKVKDNLKKSAFKSKTTKGKLQEARTLVRQVMLKQSKQPTSEAQQVKIAKAKKLAELILKKEKLAKKPETHKPNEKSSKVPKPLDKPTTKLGMQLKPISLKQPRASSNKHLDVEIKPKKFILPPPPPPPVERPAVVKPAVQNVAKMFCKKEGCPGWVWRSRKSVKACFKCGTSFDSTKNSQTKLDASLANHKKESKVMEVMGPVVPSPAPVTPPRKSRVMSDIPVAKRVSLSPVPSESSSYSSSSPVSESSAVPYTNQELKRLVPSPFSDTDEEEKATSSKKIKYDDI